MKIKLLLLTLVLLSIFIVSCDRFEKPEVIEYDKIVTEFFNTFSTVADSISADNTEEFMSFFDDSYLHDGMTKQDIQTMINEIFLVNESRFISVELENNNYFSVKWELITSTTDNLVVDSLYFDDQLRKVEESYILYGNRIEAPVIVEKLMPFAEIMTATWCGTCPDVESAMHEYLYSNPDNFFYLEFHSGDEIAGEHEFFDNFYGATSAPTAILQGQDIFVGDQSETYQGILDDFKEMDAQLKLNNLVQTADTENYQAQVNIENLLEDEFDTSNLKLRWAFYEETSAENNDGGVPCRHVVLTEGLYDIISTDLDNTFSISIDYPRDIPEDMGIVFWLQTANDTYDDDSFVHAWIKQDIIRSK